MSLSSSLLQLNVHDHSVISDGVFAEDADRQLTFFGLPPPTDADVESIALGIAKAVTKALANADPPADDDHLNLAITPGRPSSCQSADRFATRSDIAEVQAGQGAKTELGGSQRPMSDDALRRSSAIWRVFVN